MVNRETNELLDDIMLDNIASMSKEQLKGELNGKVSDLDAIIKRVSAWGTSQKKQASLSVLQAARKGMESQLMCSLPCGSSHKKVRTCLF